MYKKQKRTGQIRIQDPFSPIEIRYIRYDKKTVLTVAEAIVIAKREMGIPYHAEAIRFVQDERMLPSNMKLEYISSTYDRIIKLAFNKRLNSLITEEKHWYREKLEEELDQTIPYQLQIQQVLLNIASLSKKQLLCIIQNNQKLKTLIKQSKKIQKILRRKKSFRDYFNKELIEQAMNFLHIKPIGFIKPDLKDAYCGIVPYGVPDRFDDRMDFFTFDHFFQKPKTKIKTIYNMYDSDSDEEQKKYKRDQGSYLYGLTQARERSEKYHKYVKNRYYKRVDQPDKDNQQYQIFRGFINLYIRKEDPFIRYKAQLKQLNARGYLDEQENILCLQASWYINTPVEDNVRLTIKCIHYKRYRQSREAREIQNGIHTSEDSSEFEEDDPLDKKINFQKKEEQLDHLKNWRDYLD